MTGTGLSMGMNGGGEVIVGEKRKSTGLSVLLGKGLAGIIIFVLPVNIFVVKYRWITLNDQVGDPAWDWGSGLGIGNGLRVGVGCGSGWGGVWEPLTNLGNTSTNLAEQGQ